VTIRKCINGTILCNFVHSSTRFFVEEVFGRWKNLFRCLFTPLHSTYEHTKTIIVATAILHNMCQLCNDLDNSYFDGTDGSIPGHTTFGFPVSPLASYEATFPLSKIIFPRCKQMSNGVMTSKFRNGEVQGHGCDCFSQSLISRASIAFLHRDPTVQRDLTSDDPILRREAYCKLLFHSMPKNY
jgi:hypothetical protein